MTRYRLTTYPGDEYRSDNEIVVECDETSARRLLPIWAEDAPNLTECREVLADGTLSKHSVVSFGYASEDRANAVGRARG